MAPDSTLDGKVVVVTGASRGIGAAYVGALLGAGARVIALARAYSDPAAAARQAGDGEGDVVRWPCDLFEEAQIRDTVDRIIAAYSQIDVLVNNAGAFPHFDSLAMSADEWDSVMNLNVRGVYLMIRYVAPHMIARGAGSIVNVSSGSALHTAKGSPGHEGLGVYGISKAAGDRLTDYFAEELAGHGIAVNGLRPGGVLTDTWKQVDPEAFAKAEASGVGSPCLPEVIGPPMLFLAAQTAETMTGRVVAAKEYGKSWP
jgi:3-oxoacyl-[acyl-carrier protein] reductase